VTISKGSPWGGPGVLPGDGVVVRSDAEARAALEAARRERRPYPTLGLLGGDLCRTAGGTGAEARLRDGTGMVLPVDLGEALVDGRVHLFVAHAVVRGRSLWRGRVVAAMNAQFVGRWDVAPRAHPGDALLDVVEVDPAMGVGERWKARGRLRSGTHVPHPSIRVRRVDAVQLDGEGQSLWLDGVRVGPFGTLSLRVEPDALNVVV
jgi:hypothetical protein